ncbi:MAG: outer membrane beta-barrel protein [Candidatus Eisenbacteria bacterium]|nr:outer membrane beta-barrel protein [Candidatus Eisenbacteria bacterium]
MLWRTLTAAMIVAMLAAVPAWATPDKPMSFALKGGVNPAFQELEPDPDNRDGSLLGYGGGATLGINLSPSFSVDTDFLYVQKGGKYKDVFRNGNDMGGEERVFKSQVEMNYIVVNPMFRIAPNTDGARPYLMAGPEFGYLIDAQWSYEDDRGKSTEDAKEEFKETDFGINMGGGLEIPMQGSTSFFFEGRYSMGMTDVTDINEEESERGSAKNRSIFVFGGLRF